MRVYVLLVIFLLVSGCVSIKSDETRQSGDDGFLIELQKCQPSSGFGYDEVKECFSFVLNKSRDSSICDRLGAVEGDERRGFCFRSAAKVLGDSNLCYKIGSDNATTRQHNYTRDGCFSDSAISKGESRLCGLIYSIDTRDECYRSVAVSLKDSTICYLVRSETYKEQCLAGSSPDEDGRILSTLLAKLNSSEPDYSGFYRKDEIYSSWSGGSGSTDWTEISWIFMDVRGNSVINYTMNFTRMAYGGYSYVQYYDEPSGKMCKKYFVTESDCNPVSIPRLKIRNPLMGCKLEYDSTGVIIHSCICGGAKVLLYDDRSKTTQIPPCLGNIWQEGMHVGWGYVTYYPETRNVSCIHEVINKSGRYWAVFCDTENLSLTPAVSHPETLRNVVCKYADGKHSGGGGCSCWFDLTELSECVDGSPMNLDLSVKANISRYLSTVNVESISVVTDVKYGTCYRLFQKNVSHKFCFSDTDLLTYANWGYNYSGTLTTHEDVITVEKIM